MYMAYAVAIFRKIAVRLERESREKDVVIAHKLFCVYYVRITIGATIREIGEDDDFLLIIWFSLINFQLDVDQDDRGSSFAMVRIECVLNTCSSFLLLLFLYIRSSSLFPPADHFRQMTPGYYTSCI